MNEAIHYLRNCATSAAKIYWNDDTTTGKAACTTQSGREEQRMQCEQQAMQKEQAGRPSGASPSTQQEHSWSQNQATGHNGIRLYDGAPPRACYEEDACIDDHYDNWDLSITQNEEDTFKQRWKGIRGLDGDIN